MKREGRQHGLVRTFRILPDPLNPRPESRLINSPPTAGLFQRVPCKPSNHSKFTGKCGRARCVGCHIHPASKSKDKAKGSHKLRFSDHHLLGFSAVGMVHHLTCADDLDHHDDDFYDDPAIGLSESDETDDGQTGEDLGMSYCDVGFTLEEVEIEIDFEGWCVVAEL